MWPGWPPLPVVIVCALMVFSAVVQAVRELPNALLLLQEHPPGWAPVGYAILALVALFFLFTVIGLWRMRRWAVVARLLLHVIAPVQMTLAWNESWERTRCWGRSLAGSGSASSRDARCPIGAE
jgi:hypothetical protein